MPRREIVYNAPMLFDFHVHTRRYSPCSGINPYDVIPAAIAAGLDGLVLTEHHAQWNERDLGDLKEAAKAPEFVLLAGTELSSSRGDMLVFGLTPSQVAGFTPYGDPDAMLAEALALGAVCIAAHPTRRMAPFGAGIRTMPFHALEVRSSNLNPAEETAARKLAAEMGLPGTASSDAHSVKIIGRHATAFDAQIGSMADFMQIGRAHV